MPLVVSPIEKEKSSSKGEGGGQSTFIYVYPTASSGWCTVKVVNL